MNLVHILRTDPLTGIAILLCLGTIYWCIRVLRRRRTATDRVLLALLGVIAISQGLRILSETGLWTAPDAFHRLNDFANLTTSALYLIGALLLELSTEEHMAAQVCLRLAEANPVMQTSTHAAAATAKPALTFNSAGCILGCNEAAAAILGYPQDQIVGKKMIFVDYEPQNDASRALAANAEVDVVGVR